MVKLPEGFRSRLFEDVDPADVAEIVAAGQHRRVLPRQVVIHAGEPTRSVSLVVSGHFQTYLIGDSGKRMIMSRLGPGELLGPSGLMRKPLTHLVDVECVDKADLIVWPRDVMR